MQPFSTFIEIRIQKPLNQLSKLKMELRDIAHVTLRQDKYNFCLKHGLIKKKHLVKNESQKEEMEMDDDEEAAAHLFNESNKKSNLKLYNLEYVIVFEQLSLD